MRPLRGRFAAVKRPRRGRELAASRPKNGTKAPHKAAKTRGMRGGGPLAGVKRASAFARGASGGKAKDRSKTRNTTRRRNAGASARGTAPWPARAPTVPWLVVAAEVCRDLANSKRMYLNPNTRLKSNPHVRAYLDAFNPSCQTSSSASYAGRKRAQCPQGCSRRSGRTGPGAMRWRPRGGQS